MPNVKKITFTIDRVEFAGRGRERFAKRLVRYQGLFKADGGPTRRKSGLRETPDEEPCVVALGATGEFTVELDVDGKNRASVTLNLKAIGLARSQQPPPLNIVVSRPFEEKLDQREQTEDFTVYWSVTVDTPPTRRSTRPVIHGSRQTQTSQTSVPVFVTTKPRLRAVLYAPPTAATTVMSSRMNTIVRGDLGLSDKQPADGPNERLDHLFNVLRRADAQLRQGNYLTEEQQAGHVVHVFVAPEWYFRRDQRPYTQNEMITAIEGAKQRSAVDPFKRWLILPGSIYWGMPLKWQTVESRRQLRKRVARHAKQVRKLEKKIAKTKDATKRTRLEAELRSLQAQNPYGVGEPSPELIRLEQEIQRLDQQIDELWDRNRKKAERLIDKKHKLEEKRTKLYDSGAYSGPTRYQKWRVFNTVPVIHNGKLVSRHSKRYEADIGDHRTEAWGMTDEKMAEGIRKGVAKSGTFSFDGLEFGVEVCMDHTMARLLGESIAAGGVDVHVVIANNVSDKPAHYAARHDGCYFRCDAAGHTRVGQRIQRKQTLRAARVDYEKYLHTQRRKQRASQQNDARQVRELQQSADNRKNQLAAAVQSNNLQGDRSGYQTIFQLTECG